MPLNVIAQYAYSQYYFSFPADMEHFLVTNSATKATVVYPTEGLVIRLNHSSAELQVLDPSTPDTTAHESYFVSRALDFNGIMIDTRPKPNDPDQSRSVVRVAGIGVTVLLDIDPVTLDYHTLDFEGLYQVVIDGTPTDAIASHIRFNLVDRTALNWEFTNSAFNKSDDMPLKMLAVTVNLDLVQ